MIKRSFAILTILFFAFASSTFGASLQGNNASKSSLSNKKKVRVIVELDQEPTIEHAQKARKLFKDLPKSEQDQLEKKAKNNQQEIIKKAEKDQLQLKVLNQFTTVVNGFSASVPYENIKKIAKMDGVAKVYISNEYKRPTTKPQMIYSKELVEAQRVWDNYKLKGEGIVVGIIDTGIDPTHKDLTLSSTKNMKLSKATVQNVIKQNKLTGKFINDKVPYGYNYYDQNDTILDIGSGASMHGMHVAGTVAANGDEQNGGIKGVAPEAQLLALKVFSNDPEYASTYSDIIIKAIDDGIKLGADVLNLSLGSAASFVEPDSPEQMAVKRAANNGIMLAISAGNSGHTTYGWDLNPFATNVDVGTVGAPGLVSEAFTVASFENKFIDLNQLSFTVDGKEDKVAYQPSNAKDPNQYNKTTFDIVNAGLGLPEDIEKVDLKGKYALIQRGKITFVEKMLNAQEAGAEGVIIFNNTDGYISMATDAKIDIPQLGILKADGEKLKAELESGKTAQVSFKGEKQKSANPNEDKMSDFTSWGVTPNLDFKPEITAPGGQILSTFNNNSYGMMSGTSMAAPHVAGGSALLLERLKSTKVAGIERVKLAKNMMMNTALPIIDKGPVNTEMKFNIPYSPRRQGAGLMQLHAALSTPVVVTEKKSNEAKVALKELANNKAAFQLKVKNVTNQAVEYNVALNVQTDLALEGMLGVVKDQLEAQPLKDVVVKINGAETNKVSVPANGESEISVELDASNAKVLSDDGESLVAATSVFPNGYFVEGFVTLKDVKDTNPTISVPYVGFNGKWDQAPIFDEPAWSENSLYGLTSIADEGKQLLGYDATAKNFSPEKVAFSPNGDQTQDLAIPAVSFLRNAKNVEVRVLDRNNKVLRTITKEDDIIKSYFDGGGEEDPYHFDESWGWDGKIGLKTASEGDYLIEVRAVIDYSNAKWQSIKLPIKLDVTAPVLKASFEPTSNSVSIVEATDAKGGSGVKHLDILVDGKSILDKKLSPDTKAFTLPKALSKQQTLNVVAYDYAGNKKDVALQSTVDQTPPDVHVMSPEAIKPVNTREIVVAGYVKEPSGLKSLTIDGKKVEFSFNEEKSEYEFSTTLKYKTDGVKNYKITAVDQKGNNISFSRTVIVDATKAKITVSNVPKSVSKKTKSIKVNVTIEDNFDQINAQLNGNHILTNTFKEPYQMRPYKKTLKGVELKLQDGNNKFVFTVKDLGGNVTTKTIYIKK